MSTTEPIIIPIEGDPSDFVKDSAKVNAELDKMARGTKAASGANTGMAQAAKSASMSVTDLLSAYRIATEAARVAGQVWQATGQEFVNYAEQVKNMSRSLGASAEETSRLIQVADDVRISYDTLKIAMKEAQKDGIDPNIEGLAKLADQYVKIQSPTEKTKFLLDKFGKSGMEMGKLMEKGGDGIRKMSAAIDENLVITDQGIQASDQYQHSLDELNDSWSAIKITIGSYLVGPATDLLNHYRDITTSLKENGYWYTVVHQFSLDDIAAKREEADAAFQAASANNEFSGALDGNAGALADNKDAVEAAKDALKNYQDQLDAVSKENMDNEQTSRQYAEDQRQYEEDHKKALEDQAEAQRKLSEVEAEWRDGGEANQRLMEDVTFAQHDLNDAIAKYGENSDEAAKARRKLDDAMAATSEGDQKIMEAKAAYDETTKSVQKLEAESLKARDAMVYDMVATKLAVDGLTDSELKALDAYAVSKGIKTQADVDETNRRIEEANTVVEGIKASEDVMVEDKKIAEEKKRLETAISTEEAIAASEEQAASMGIVKDAVDSATLSYQAMAKAAWDAAAAAQSAAGSSSTSTGASSGGLSPDERGSSSSTTMNKSSTFNISIHNPVGDNSANSIRRTLKQTSYLGFPA